MYTYNKTNIEKSGIAGTWQPYCSSVDFLLGLQINHPGGIGSHTSILFTMGKPHNERLYKSTTYQTYYLRQDALLTTYCITLTDFIMDPGLHVKNKHADFASRSSWFVTNKKALFKSMTHLCLSVRLELVYSVNHSCAEKWSQQLAKALKEIVRLSPVFRWTVTFRAISNESLSCHERTLVQVGRHGSQSVSRDKSSRCTCLWPTCKPPDLKVQFGTTKFNQESLPVFGIKTLAECGPR